MFPRYCSGWKHNEQGERRVYCEKLQQGFVWLMGRRREERKSWFLIGKEKWEKGGKKKNCIFNVMEVSILLGKQSLQNRTVTVTDTDAVCAGITVKMEINGNVERCKKMVGIIAKVLVAMD